MRKNHGMLLGGVAIAAILAGASYPAQAFDEVTWIWNADVTTTIETAVTAVTDIAPTGLNQVENEQSDFGTLAATSDVTGVEVEISPDLTGPAPLDDLAVVETKATAMGNSAAIESDVSIQYDSSQIFGGIAVTLTDPVTGDPISAPAPGTITAASTASEILNAAVDSDAVGVANNLTVDLVTTSDQDAFAIGNNVQMAEAAITSTSMVDAVTIGAYSDLGTLDSPVVSSNAASLGNNFAVAIDGIN